MNNKIWELNIPEEEKILLSKIDKKVNFLSDKSEDFFKAIIQLDGTKLESAYSVNEDLISILKTNSSLTEQLKKDSFTIRETHQTDFTREVQLDLSEEVMKSSIIKSTIEHKDELISSDEKLFALSKRKNYIKNKNTKRKAEMDSAIEALEQRIENEQLLNIEPMREDIELIKKYINPKEINKTRYLYLFIFVPMILVALSFGGALLWMI